MLKDRLDQIKKQLKSSKLDAVFISSVSNITYLTGYANFSNIEREAYLIIGEDFQYIITDGRYSEAVKKEVPSHFTLYERNHKKTVEDLFKQLKSGIKEFGIEEDNLTVSEYKVVSKHFKKLKHFELGSLRGIKTKEEIKKIAQAAKIADKAFEFILKKIKVGVTEKEIGQDLERFINDQGVATSFPSIVAFGKNSSVPHHQTGNKKLDSGGQFVLLDFGVKFENYCSDMTRTVIFGEPSKKQKEIHAIVHEAQKKASEFLSARIKAGKAVIASEVDKVARDYIISKGYPSIPHSLGHGIGLEVHEHPYLSFKSKEELKEGMVFSIEPGIYLPDFGGVRIEDLYVLEKDELKQLTNSSKDLINV